MKTTFKFFVAAPLLVFAVFSDSSAQAYNTPLTIQALNHTTNASVISRSLGGLTLSSQNDVTTMFSNPAAMQTLDGIQFSVGAIRETKTNEQIQRWYSLDWMSMFDLFMEGKTADLRDPVIDPVRVPIPTYQDSVQRNGRNPNWSRNENQFLVPQVFVAIPFQISGTKFTAGAGVVEYANANYFYANKTAFSRNIDYTTMPISANPNPERADWRADTRSRDGSIRGYGGALSAAIAKNVTVGVSGIYFSGTIDDAQSREGYGELCFFSKDFRYTENPYGMTWQGSSTITGLEMTVSSVYRTRNLMFGLSVKPPTQINRDFTTTGDSTRGAVTVALPRDNGSDQLTLPFRGTIGVGIAPRPNVLVGGEYEYIPYGSAEYTDKNGRKSKPWLDCSGFRLGLEYLPVASVSVRLGYQVKSEVFEQQGNALVGEPVSYTVYSAGIGVRVLRNIHLNIGYEFMNMQYEDNWYLNTNINKETRKTLFGGVSYSLK